MTITVLADVIVPDSIIAAGARGKQIRKNERITLQSGHATANVVWSKTLRQYELGTVPLTIEQWQALEALFEVTDAGAYGCLLNDPKDNRVTGGLLVPYTTALVGTPGFGYGVPVYKLHKRYTSLGSTRYRDRAITRPVGAALKRGGAAVTLGVAAGNAAVDDATGTVTFVADTSQALASVTVGATTVLNFANGTGIVAAMAVGERVYLSGLTGTAAAVLNGASHAITAKGATSLTISTATTGLAAAGGLAYRYPQATEALTWDGGFRTPVHFVNDEIDWDLERAGPYESRLMSGPSVVLLEVRE